MKARRFKSALLSLMEYIGEGLLWMGPMWMWPPPDALWEQPGEPPETSLSKRERSEWADLVKRLR